MIFLSQIFPQVFTALTQREGKKVTLPTLVSMTGLRPEQIQLAIRHARANNEVHARQIVVEQVGRAWRFVADPDIEHNSTPDNVAKAVEMGAKHIWRLVLKVLMDNPGRILYKGTIAEAVRKAAPDEFPEFSEQQVANAMLTILRNPGARVNIETVWSGRAWRYVAPNTATATPPATDTPASTDKSAGKAVSGSIRNSVLRYATQKPGETLFVDEIAADLGFTRKQVQNGMYNLLHDARSTVRHEFEIVTSGTAWRYVPNRTPALASSNGQAPQAAAIAAGSQVSAYAPATPTTTSQNPPAEPTSARLFEEVGKTSSGDILIQESETKTFYRAIEL